MVKKAIAYGQSKGAGILVVGNDNQPVGYGYLKGYARADAMDGEISDAGIYHPRKMCRTSEQGRQ